jgi:hypothetical protein
MVKTKKSFKRKVYRKKRTVKPTTIKKMIKRQIALSAENKCRQFFQNTPTTLYSSYSSALLDGSIIPLTPFAGVLQIDQGVGQGDRVGNIIKVKKLTFKGTITPLLYDIVQNSNPQPTQIKCWIFYDKRDPTIKPTPSAQANFFQFNSTSAGFTNSLTDMWKPINTDIYRVLATKSWKLGLANYEVNGNGAWQTYANNDFKMNINFSFDLTKHINKTIKFIDNNSNPSTRGLFALFQVMYANGGAIGAGQRLASMQYMLDLVYEDS